MSPTKGFFRIILSVAVLLTATMAANAQPNQTRQPALREAPALKLDKILQAPLNASADWARLKGKLVVIDFWATWCSPCVEAIPHFNQMAKELADQPIVFIAVTDDEETRLNEFLKSTPIKTW